METISKLERAKKKLTPAEIRTLFADLAEPFVPGLGATRQAMSGNYGQAAVSGLLDFGGPIGKAAGLAAAPMMGAIKVFHGSPHKFDKFDMSKIGTGEGAQVYGHGLYFAENPQVAKEYQKNLSGDVFKVGDKVFDPSQIEHLNVRSLVRKGDLSGAIEKASTISKSDSPVADVARKDLEVLKQINSLGGLQKTSGNLYEVNLRWPGAREATDPLGPQHFLDYDKLLSEQSEFVKDKLAKIGHSVNKTTTVGEDPYNPFGERIISKLASTSGGEAAASEILRGAGIPGVRYLDAGSRSNFRVQTSYKGEPYGEPVSFMTEQQALNYAKEQKEKGFGADVMPGTSNYVTFDDQLAEILRRNPGLL